MRVLVIPEFYRPDDATANGTVNDAVAWIEEWLDRGRRLHVYLLVPPRESAAYDPGSLLGDHDRVTLIEAEFPLSNLDDRNPFTEMGYSSAQLQAIRREIYETGAYVDVVVDQLRSGRETLYKWLLESVDQWAASVQPFDVVGNVHDLQVPRKYRYCSYRNDFQFRLESAAVAFADGVWFTAGVDANGFREHVDFLADDVVEQTLEDAIVAGSPIPFDRYDEEYADEPEWLHLAGSFWSKKNVDKLFDIARTLYRDYSVETVLTSMEPIPEEYRQPEWVEAHGEASRTTYEKALQRGDLTIHASDYETMARTPFEQAASGQVLILRDAPWARECVPDDHPLLASVGQLTERAVDAIENWPASVAANQQLVSHARTVRGTEACGRRTYRDLRHRVEQKVEQYEKGKSPMIIARAAADCGNRFCLKELSRTTADYTADGQPLPDRESYATTDLIHTLRSLGFADEGNPGTPIFSTV